MKKTFVLTVLSLMAVFALANNYRDCGYNYKFEGQKTIEKTFDVEAMPNLTMEGRYSDFIITTWDQPQIEFFVKITVKSDKESAVQKLMEIINVELTQEDNSVKARTVFVNKTNKSFNASISIKYYVKVPKDVAMDLETIYGDITIDKAQRKLKTDIKYGDFKADSLIIDNIQKNIIEVRYGNININVVSQLYLDMSYGEAKINKCDYIDGTLKYSKLFITDLDHCMLENKYSDTRIEKANKVVLSTAAYSDIKVRNLTNLIGARLRYSDLSVTSTSLTPKIDIDGLYSDVVLYLNKDASFDYKLASSYGDIKFKGFFDKNSISGVGHYGDGERGLLDISTKYGDVDIYKNK